MAYGRNGMSSTGFSGQFLRFGVAGVATNLLLYLVYLALVGIGLQYPVAMTVAYVAGVVVGFTVHRRWTFRYRGSGTASAARYLVAYAAGYLLNLLGLWLLVEHARAGPASAQAVMVIVVAMCLYLGQKHWVFRAQSPAAGHAGPPPLPHGHALSDMSDLAPYSATLQRDERGIWYAGSSAPVSDPAQGHATCLAVEAGSFWFRHRNRCILAAVRRYPPLGPIFDIGGGNGFVARALLDDGWGVVLVEPAPEGAMNARARGLPHVVSATLDTAAFAPGTLPAVGVFDVVEHIQDDLAFLRRLAYLIQPGGHLYVTVPAHAALWSDEDVLAGHHRRYGPAEFTGRVQQAGFEVLYSTQFFRPLLPPIFLMRTLPYRVGLRRGTASVEHASREHGAAGGPLVAIMQRALEPEVGRIENGKQSRIGASLLLVARKPR